MAAEYDDEHPKELEFQHLTNKKLCMQRVFIKKAAEDVDPSSTAGNCMYSMEGIFVMTIPEQFSRYASAESMFLTSTVGMFRNNMAGIFWSSKASIFVSSATAMFVSSTAWRAPVAWWIRELIH